MRSGAAKKVMVSTFRIGHSRVSNEGLQEYVRQGLLNSEFSMNFRAPRNEEVPQPKPYEAVVFRDYFVTGLCFWCETFRGCLVAPPKL